LLRHLQIVRQVQLHQGLLCHLLRLLLHYYQRGQVGHHNLVVLGVLEHLLLQLVQVHQLLLLLRLYQQALQVRLVLLHHQFLQRLLHLDLPGHQELQLVQRLLGYLQSRQDLVVLLHLLLPRPRLLLDLLVVLLHQ